jgi:phosphoribosylglycinamide formyltransferase-1
MINIGFMASHGGSGMKAILQAIQQGLKANPKVCICNNRQADAFNVAQAYHLATYYLSSATHKDQQLLDQAICSALQEQNIEILLLSGYMKKLGPLTLSAYKNRILNIHPSLLPKHGGAGMYGDRVHQAVIDDGATESGATVHIVTAEYDQGPILKQECVVLDDNETLESVRKKVRNIEGNLYVETLSGIVSGDILLP